MREDGQSSKSEYDRRLSDTVQKYNEEKEMLKKQHSSFLKGLQQDCDTQKGKARKLEKKLQNQEFDYQEKINHLRQDYEDKIRGLMPAQIREELEDTISSLKSQVNSLQQRAMVLQEELDTKNKYSMGFGSPSRM
ncbi:centrosomal protein of 112 kDa-like [Saccoglossus kowalevskii]|uniref:Centrosomal protein of 112 kDa-like n=1 Tax=Saccoglossus kowalevskii TaxID=10224 RepID=A0ABM0M3Z4_SACKO|nr:PREDICTED: centrosomal protein of 112 kDa-like [Saccoglossus kowalevskii]